MPLAGPIGRPSREASLPQRLKAEIRARITAAAAAVFAEKGYSAARLSDIAARADLSAANIYKYFSGKEALFGEIVTPPLAAQLLKRLRARVRELATLDDWSAANASGSDHARALVAFWVENRLPVLILLDGAAGTRYEHIRSLVTKELVRLALGYVRDRQGASALSPAKEFVLDRLFAHTVGMIADILRAHDDACSIQLAFAEYWRYHLAGLQILLNRPPQRTPDKTGYR